MFAGVRRIPLLIALLFAADCALILIPVIDYAVGHPFQRLSNLFNLDAERTVPTWYSSIQWFCAGAMFGSFASHAWHRRMRGALCIASVALACVVFSVDEIAEIHERLGFATDALLSGGTRDGTALWSTGLWPILIGIPATLAIAIVVRGTRHILLARAPRALLLLVAGFIVMFTGALAVEMVANLVSADKSSGAFLAQVVVEEGLEMIGVTLIAWSAYALLEAYDLDISVHPTAGASAPMQSAGS
jgi:hypothetical protein